MEVRNAGVKCLGLFCLLNLEAARNNLLLFLQVVKNDRDQIKVTAIKVKKFPPKILSQKFISIFFIHTVNKF